jgi:hypothetical protein
MMSMLATLAALIPVAWTCAGLAYLAHSGQ